MYRIHELCCNVPAFHLKGHVLPGGKKVIHKLRLRKYFGSNIFNENPAVGSVEMKVYVIKIQNTLPTSNFRKMEGDRGRKETNCEEKCRKGMSGDGEVEMHLGVSPLENVTLHESFNAAI